MENTRKLIHQAYAAFNQRDIDRALALMSDSISWPKASEGGRVVGKEEIRAYWTRQWAEFDPHVEPIEVVELDGGEVEGRVHQVVRDLAGAVLADQEVWHLYTVGDGLLLRMDLKDDGTGSDKSPSSAFSGQAHVK